MRHLTIAMIAAGAMSFSAAHASPFNSLNMSDNADQSVENDAKGLLGLVMDKVALSVSLTLGKFAYAADEAEVEAFAEEECEGAEATPEEEIDADEDKAPVGPEPIYFGF